VCCSVLQCVAVCCSVLQCGSGDVQVCCKVLKGVTACCSICSGVADGVGTKKWHLSRAISDKDVAKETYV